MSSYDFVQHGQTLVESGQYQEAVKVCRLGLLAHPTAIAGRLTLGNALIALRRYDEVLAEMRVALEIDSTNARALGLKGEALLHKGDTMQAAHILNQAYAYAPADKRLAALCRQAEDLLAQGAADAFEAGDFADNEISATKHYPAHRGLAHDDLDGLIDDTGDQSGNVTRPQTSLAERRDASEPLAASTGSTMDIDPLVEGYELEDYDLDAEPLDPDVAGDDFNPADSMAMTRTYELEQRLAAGRDAGAGEVASDFDEPEAPTAAETAHYRPLAHRDTGIVLGDDDLEEDLTGEETRALGLRDRGAGPAYPQARQEGYAQPPQPGYPQPPRPAYPQPPQPGYAAGASPQELAAKRRTVLSSSPGNPPPVGPPPLTSSPPIDELFPERDHGLSAIVQIPDAVRSEVAQADVGRAVHQMRAPHQPTLAITTGKRAESRAEDMEVIRAGLGLRPEQSGQIQSIMEPAPQPAPQPPAYPAPAPPQPAYPAPPPPAPAQPVYAPPARPGKDRRGSTVAVSPHIRTNTMARKRSPLVYLLYALSAMIVVAGGIFAGFKIREIRLDREIHATESDALAFAKDDTYSGYLRARNAYSGIVSVRATKRTRSALARMQAAITAEFGDGLEETRAMVEKLGGINNSDAALARAYLALAEGNPDIARLRAGEVEKGYPSEPLGPYLRGRAALLANKPDDAIAAFEKALQKDSRPFIHIGLAYAHLAKGAFAKARAALERAQEASPRHPDVVIGQARVAVASGAAPADAGQLRADLLAIINDYDKDGAAGASQRQRARAALTLASVALMRGDRDGAQRALGQVRELMSRDDRYFSRDYIHVLMAAGDIEAAEKEAKRAAKTWPDAVQARLALAELAMLRGKPETVFEVLEDDVSDSAKGLAVRGRAHLSLGNIDAAVKDIDAALAVSPNLPDVLAARAEVDLAMGKIQAAEERLQPIFSQDALPQVRVVYAAILREQGKFKEARAIIEPLLDMPPAERAYLELARVDRDRGEFARAKEDYDKVLASAPQSIDARLESALLARDTGDIKTARTVLEELVSAHPDSSRVLLAAAPIFTMTGAKDLTLKVLEDAARLDWAPRWQIERERGRLAMRQGERSAALSALTTARNLNDKDAEARLLLIQAQLKEDDSAAARKSVEDILKNFVERPRPYLTEIARARLDLYEERIDDAIKLYKAVRERLIKQRATPRDIAYTEYWLGRAHFLADRLKDARKWFASSVKRDPGNPDAQFYLGLTSQYLKRWKTTERAMQACLDIDTLGNPEAWFYLGEAQYNRKRWGEAKKSFKQYLARYPEGYLATDSRTYLRRLR